MTENLDNLPGIARRREKEREKLKEERKKYKLEWLLKISIIGSNFELRDKLIRSYAGGVTDPYAMTLGVDVSTLKITVKDTKLKLIMVNIQDKVFDIRQRQNYYRGSSAGIIIFDKSDRPSFEKVTQLLEEFRKRLPSPTMVSIGLLGINTIEEDVSSDEGKALAELLDLPYFETSSPKFENANEIFEYLTKKVIGEGDEAK